MIWRFLKWFDELLPWLLLTGAICGGIGLLAGMHFGALSAEKRLLDYQAEVKQANTNALTAASRLYREQVAHGQVLAQQLVAQQTELERLRSTLHERIPHVTTVYQTAPQQAPVAIPRCVFTRGWVRDYNAAFGLDLPGLHTTAAGFDATAQASEAATVDGELLDSQVTPADILAHAFDTASYYRNIEAQLDAVIAERMRLSLRGMPHE